MPNGYGSHHGPPDGSGGNSGAARQIWQQPRVHHRQICVYLFFENYFVFYFLSATSLKLKKCWDLKKRVLWFVWKSVLVVGPTFENPFGELILEKSF